MLTFMPTGQTLLFSVNGTAKATKRFQDINPYWADDRTSRGPRCR